MLKVFISMASGGYMRDLIQFRVSKHDELLATIIEELEKDGEEKKDT